MNFNGLGLVFLLKKILLQGIVFSLFAIAPAQLADQTISVSNAAPSSAVYNSIFSVSASASSGLDVTYSSGSTSVCTNNGSTFVMKSGSGTCKVLFNQSGNDTYNAAPQVEEDVSASKADQQISIASHAPSSAGYNSTFTVSANASSGLPVTYSSGTTSICTNSGATFRMLSGSGTCQVLYSQDGNGNYNAAQQLSDTVTATIASQTININTHAPSSAAVNSYFTVSASASSGLAVTYGSNSPSVCTNSGATFNIISSSGTCVVTYTQAGDSNYSPAPQKSESVSATQASQTITVTTHAPSSAQINTSFTVAANASSGLPVTYSSGDNSVCTNSGATFIIRSSPGVCPVQYNQGGNANYSAAPQVVESVSSTENHVTQPPTATPTIGPTLLVRILTSTPNKDGSVVHIVQRGETLAEIAAAYGVTSQKIMTLNNLASAQLKVGQVLIIIPGFTSTITTTATTTSATPSATPTQVVHTPTKISTITPSATYLLYKTATPRPPSVVESIFTKRNLIIMGIVVAIGLLVIAFIITI